MPDAAPEPDSDDEEVQLENAAAAEEEEKEELAVAVPEGFADLAEEAEQVLIPFSDMVHLLVKEGEQLRTLSGPPVMDKTLVGRTVAVRLVDVGWCSGMVVGQSSASTVKSYNYKVRWDAEDVEELWLRGERYVGSSTFSSANDWAELDACGPGSWTLTALSVAPRGVPASVARAGGTFQVTAAVLAAAAARAVQPQPIAVRPAAVRPAVAGTRKAVAKPSPPSRAAAAGAAAGPAGAPRMRRCWRPVCGRDFPEGQGDPNDSLACGNCEHFPSLPAV